MDVVELAKRTLAVLDMQKDYFRTRDAGTLAECKRAEKQLRADCAAVLNPVARPATEEPRVCREYDGSDEETETEGDLPPF